MQLVEAQLHGDAADVGTARSIVVAALTDAGLGDLADTAALLASELVTNAVLHARSAVTVRVVLDHRVRVEVEDGSPVHPVRKHYSERSATGRGLMLVETLGHDWGVDDLPGGKRVWFVLDPDRSGTGTADAFDDAASVGAAASVEDLDLDTLARSFGEVDASADAPELLLVP